MEKEYFILKKIEEIDEEPVKFIFSILKFNTTLDVINKLLDYAKNIIYDEKITLVNHIIFSYNDIYKNDECIINFIINEPKGTMKIIQLSKIDNCENKKLKAFVGSIFSANPEKYLGLDEDMDVIIHSFLDLEK